MKNKFKEEVREAFRKYRSYPAQPITEDDLMPMPVMVQKYLRNAGTIGKEKVWNFRAEMKGRIRGKPSDPWMNLTSVQYNFVDDPTRIFYIKAKKMGIPAIGLHLYKNEKARMVIKLAGLFTVADAKGPEMDQGETVTVFNDMCFMAPATLISRNIKWEILDLSRVKAYFTNGNITISAILTFNEEGYLVNFVSNDRFETTDGKSYKNYPWHTPVKVYREINGRLLPSKAEAIYQYPDREFCYAEFEISDIKYNDGELY